MVWVFGNSHERLFLKDLNDVIYFHQKKQYTDQEFEKSKDLQRALQIGKLIKLDHKPDVSSSLPDSLGSESNKSVYDFREMKRVISEVITENKPDGIDLKDLATSLIPIIAETVRQEVSKIQVQQTVQENSTDKFQDLNYVPEINMEGLKSNISIEEKQMGGSSVLNSLNVLKNLGKV